MSIFISYSHVNEEIVEKISSYLVNNNTYIWLDKWELNLGDSLIEKIQEAITECSALLVMLSKESVESTWCKKELSSGIIRELEEKRVVVIPVILDDCKIPLFLRDKLYADFRGDFDKAITKLSENLMKFTDISMNRVSTDKYLIDWALEWGYDNFRYYINIDSINFYKEAEHSILCNWNVIGNKRVYDKFIKNTNYAEKFVDDIICKIAEKYGDDLRIILHDSKTRIIEECFSFENGEKYTSIITLRWMGINDGFDKLFDYGSIIKEFSYHREKQYKY